VTKAHILQAAGFSTVILVVVVVLDYAINVVLFPGVTPYTPFATIVITLAVAPAFTTFLILQNARVQTAQAALAEERARRLAEVEAARDIAEAATRAKSAFLANMSHEIRTPLNGVLGMVQALETRELDADCRHMVATIRESGVSLMAILNDVLDLSKIEAGRMTISPVASDLMQTMQSIHQLFLPQAMEKGVRIELSTDAPAPLHLIFDPVRVRQCVSNLVSNAVKFTREGAIEIDVCCTPAANGQKCVAVRISDTGIGMNESQMESLFKAFSQADGSTTRTYGGTGLGLAISRQLARSMGGDILVSSAPGAGSQFTLTFLAAPAAPVQEAAATDGVSDRLTGRLRRSRILLADDNAINRQVARLFLQPQGAVITEAANGREVLDLLGSHPFDLILLDVHMPVMDGMETIRRIRESDEPWKTIPVVALTADAMSGDRERFIALGMTGYVSKPIEQRELLAEITRVLAGVVDEPGSVAPRSAWA
jgi:signal transduction histidine kinase/ActR/RegA family two-component response regulator